MKTQLPSAIILCALLLVLSLHAFAAGNQTTHVSSSGTSHRASNASALLANALGTRYTGYTITIQPTAAGEAAPTAALLSDTSSRTCSARDDGRGGRDLSRCRAGPAGAVPRPGRDGAGRHPLRPRRRPAPGGSGGRGLLHRE